MPTSNYFQRLKKIPAGTTVIAGPCSAEDQDQVLVTAHGLLRLDVGLFRAGVWKPRTRPGAFEGRGELALSWLVKARQETGIPVAVEVANAKHVEAALRAQIDVLWIGARTTVNPFAVQEIAEALRGVDIPIMVKNPVNPELMLWLGAIERLQEAGCQDIAAILRGFSCLSTGRWRNEPLWQIAIDLRQHLPGIPLFCDPSHIAGRSDGVAEIAQEALNLDFDGLMIEAHCCPEQAVSDAAQQLRPEELGAILAKLAVRQRTSDPGSACQQRLLELRTEIDSLDAALVTTMARRMAVSRAIGDLKRTNNLTVLQRSRWEQVLSRARAEAERLGLSVRLTEDVFKLLHQESIEIQQQILKNDDAPQSPQQP
ncbi:MAG TPA: chorismate mutase [Lentisphaeria bacterium]|nr:bifunctional 3-deoxy-7-phosphoheptulonate synthase/chorismate mutase type II [Lentisphaerota bacterium]OQC12525.1 MAG: Phospho-2-dehydro-3-deoxyheptonate aldolase [Lentisphaerae bacterium ADurb.Bin082]HPY90587.1 chorismate mutase [Lentisphaeria bacterium]HQL86622.1 chorismate mutase [Lentisphaeria bacterium]